MVVRRYPTSQMTHTQLRQHAQDQRYLGAGSGIAYAPLQVNLVGADSCDGEALWKSRVVVDHETFWTNPNFPCRESLWAVEDLQPVIGSRDAYAICSKVLFFRNTVDHTLFGSLYFYYRDVRTTICRISEYGVVKWRLKERGPHSLMPTQFTSLAATLFNCNAFGNPLQASFYQTAPLADGGLAVLTFLGYSPAKTFSIGDDDYSSVWVAGGPNAASGHPQGDPFLKSAYYVGVTVVNPDGTIRATRDFDDAGEMIQDWDTLVTAGIVDASNGVQPNRPGLVARGTTIVVGTIRDNIYALSTTDLTTIWTQAAADLSEKVVGTSATEVLTIERGQAAATPTSWRRYRSLTDGSINNTRVITSVIGLSAFLDVDAELNAMPYNFWDVFPERFEYSNTGTFIPSGYGPSGGALPTLRSSTSLPRHRWACTLDSIYYAYPLTGDLELGRPRASRRNSAYLDDPARCAGWLSMSSYSSLIEQFVAGPVIENAGQIYSGGDILSEQNIAYPICYGTSTTTSHEACRESYCAYEWDGADWVTHDLERPCPNGCECGNPPAEDGTYVGESQLVECYADAGTTTTTSTTTTTTTTTAAPTCGTCTYAWTGDEWQLAINDCDFPCTCPSAPSEPGAMVGEEVTYNCVDLTTTTTTTEDPTTTTTPAPPDCDTAGCAYYWDGAQWVEFQNDCFAGCQCPDPADPGTYVGEYAFLGCEDVP